MSHESVFTNFINEILYKLPVVRGKKSSTMIFCIIVTVLLATAATTITATAAVAVVSSSSSISFQGDQTAQHTNQQPYNATENMISTFKTADSLLTQALNDLRGSAYPIEYG